MSPRRRLLVGLLVLVVVAAGIVVGVRVLGGPGLPLPGTRPADDRPGPVLLVPGYGGSRNSLLALARRIEATGRQATVLTLVDGTGDLSAEVAVLDRAVDDALAAGAPSVDVVGYSAGGVVTALWLARDDGASRARRVVTLGAPLHGTTLATAGASLAPDACPVACRQLVPGSPELAEIDRAGVGSLLPWLSLWTTDDDTVTPPDSARLAGALDTSVQAVCAGARVTHSGLPTDPVVTGAVLRALGTTPLTTPGPADCATLRATG
ncbi:triacylglycerol lipase [Pseudonocardia sp. N23]|uniref:esterase/lipase family protein n=1 Tax=Pseudonocardia sp. N23 TaxID=1987376 RepID=UPI000BFE8643|nr:lipase [Pseudonocardia sp. N23]GAY10346.1 lipase, class 2 [Pseudonocardia sp. N23]